MSTFRRHRRHSASRRGWRPPFNACAILDVARIAGLQLPDSPGPKYSLHCPFHEDEHASAFLDGARGIFYCSVCTAPVGWSCHRFALALGLPSRAVALASRSATEAMRAANCPGFTPSDARELWALARERMVAQGLRGPDADVGKYLRLRGLLRAAAATPIGVLAHDMALPPAVRTWPSRGYRLLAPLHDASGNVAQVQARAITATVPKVMFPNGSRASGTVFASPGGVNLLAGRRIGGPAVIGEGLTDFLALVIATTVPVLSVPGTSLADAAIGPWVRGCDLLLAFDQDESGEQAIGRVSALARAAGAVRVRRVRWPAGCTDACDVLRGHGLEQLRNSLGEYGHE